MWGIIKKMIISLMSASMIVGCSQERNTDKLKIGEYGFFEHNGAISDFRDEWYLFLSASYFYDSFNDFAAKFEYNEIIFSMNGYHKYSNSIRDYFVKVTNQNTNEIIGEIQPQVLSLAAGKEYEDISKLVDFFNDKQMNHAISISDLDEIELMHFDKDDIVELYNQAIIQNLNQLTYELNQRENFFESSVPAFYSYKNDITFTSFYFNNFGYLEFVELHAQSASGNFLFVEELKEIEGCFIEKQTLSINECNIDGQLSHLFRYQDNEKN